MVDRSGDAIVEKHFRLTLKGVSDCAIDGQVDQQALRRGWRHHPFSQFLPDFEVWNPFPLDRYRLTGFWVAGLAGRAVMHTEAAESSNLYPTTVSQRRMDGPENLCHRHFSILLHQLWKAFGELGDEFGAGHGDILRRC